MTAKPKKEADLLLRAFLDEAEETRCDHLLEEIICQHARPIIRRVVASKLNVSRGRCDTIEWQEQEDIAEEVIVQLIRHLKGMRGPGAEPFDSFDDYVATAALNACSNYLRAKHPERSRLRERLRYLLSHHEQLGMWRSEGSEWLCGLISWKDRAHSPAPSGRLREITSDSRFIKYDSNPSSPEDELLRLVRSIFELVSTPVKLTELIDVVGDILGTNARTMTEPHDQFSGTAGHLWSEAEALVTERIDKQAYLKKVWKEICELPREQCAALLLNLKDNKGSDITTAFVSAGVTTIGEMAGVLGLTIERFLDMWKTLPLSDEEIAARLGTSVKQVGSLRQSARRRLWRRMEMSKTTCR